MSTEILNAVELANVMREMGDPVATQFSDVMRLGDQAESGKRACIQIADAVSVITAKMSPSSFRDEILNALNVWLIAKQHA